MDIASSAYLMIAHTASSDRIKNMGVNMQQIRQWDIIITKPAPGKMQQWQRFRGWTIRILEELQNSGGMSNLELAERINCRRKDIKDYCLRLYRAGCIDRVEKWGWKITTTGLFLLSIQLSDSSSTLKRHLSDTKTTVRQTTLAPYINPEYSDPELAVTNLLISHYNKTGQKFIYIKDQLDLCERLEVPPNILAESLRNLRQDGVCYLWRDREYGAYQLRLKPAFLERVKYV